MDRDVDNDREMEGHKVSPILGQIKLESRNGAKLRQANPLRGRSTDRTWELGAGHGNHRGENIVRRRKRVGSAARLDLARPADHRRHPDSAL